ncbi:MAG: tetratricopeptide repeat protein, partial [Myxococcaceae bacterium]
CGALPLKGSRRSMTVTHTPRFAMPLALNLVSLQRHDRAAELFARADALHKEEPSVTRELAGALLELARFAEAEATLQDGLRRWPEDATLFCNLALVQLLSGRSGEAQASVEQALVLAPEDGISRNVRALIDDIASGKRPLPKSLAELEGRAPSQRTD